MNSKPDETTIEPRRARGRPAKLSELAIVEAALALLATSSVDDLTLARLAQSLGTSTMSLYNYFPNRDALLDAAANHAFSQLVLPAPGKRWQDNLLGWLWAVQGHFDRYPVVPKMMGWDGKIPSAWLRVTIPVIRELQRLGLHGEELTFAANWFLSSATGLMLVESVAPAYRKPSSFPPPEALAPDELETLLEIQRYRLSVNRQELLDFGFRQIVEGLKELLPKVRRTRPTARGKENQSS